MRTPERLADWSAFERRLHELYAEYENMRTKNTSRYGQSVSNLLFRGQSNADWGLTSTLDRFAEQYDRSDLLNLETYYRGVWGAKPQVQAYTGTSWELKAPGLYMQETDGNPFVSSWFQGQVYEYLIYLRHHGFPSPLLDWSRSPYVAAFFAFAGARQEHKEVAVYAYLEWAGEGKSGSSGDHEISGLGPYVAAHKRHFIQQCEYTVCMVSGSDPKRFGSYQTAFEMSGTGQDILWKFILPATERLDILRMLDRHNINSLSLFASDESLMETVALRELIFRD